MVMLFGALVLNCYKRDADSNVINIITDVKFVTILRKGIGKKVTN